MIIKQLSVVLENKPGCLMGATQVLAEAGINMRALTLTDTADHGVLRLILEKPEEARELLETHGFSVKVTQVLAVEMDDSPGGLNTVLKALASEDINIEYMYAFMGAKPRKALVIFRINQTEKAVDCLQENGVRLISTEKEVEELIHFCWE